MGAEFSQDSVYRSNLYHLYAKIGRNQHMRHGVSPLELTIYLGRQAIDIKVINNVKFQFLYPKYVI